jgi:hypothetical protein
MANAPEARQIALGTIVENLQNLEVDPRVRFAEGCAADRDRLTCIPASERACLAEPFQAVMDLLKVPVDLGKIAVWRKHEFSDSTHEPSYQGESQ